MSAHTVALLVLDLAVIAAVAQLLSRLARHLGQPPVIGEILGGILLGPTLFGGAVTRTLFPAAVLPSLTALANIGVGVFMFLIGVELDRNLLRGQGRVAAGVAASAIIVPFTLGVVLALYLYSHHPGPSRTAFVLFLGTAMAVTAFPVLARILADRGLLRTPIGALALACASLDDILAWSLLAVVAAIASSVAGLWRIALIVPFAAVLLLVVPPLLARLARRLDALDRDDRAPDRDDRRWARVPVWAAAVAMIGAGLWLSAQATQWMGLHLIFGAFLFGVVIPREHAVRLREWVIPKVRGVCAVLLLPVFFMAAGLNVNLSNLNAAAFGELGLILLVAIGGKGLGAYTGARFSGVRVRHSAVLAILINTRGLTELIVLTVGRQLHVLDARLYSLMVVMALVTTAMTGVLLRLVYPEARAQADMAPRATVSGTEAMS
ncbi:cation:proton antiporter [Nocardia sp. NPDC088792]|uniref:cation:proton antiporter domain-containing protein n=1 Tax=Nocardia sp. NPDC088792 TaxID=3364332 RepID=UPI0037F3F969